MVQTGRICTLEISVMDQKLQETLRNIREMNRDEQFYKAYFQAGKSEETLRRFLKEVDIEDAVRRHLVIPELLPDIISYYMDDSEYFSENDGRNIFISRHNRYTPGFTHKHNFLRSSMSIPGNAARISVCSVCASLREISFSSLRESFII